MNDIALNWETQVPWKESHHANNGACSAALTGARLLMERLTWKQALARLYLRLSHWKPCVSNADVLEKV